MQKFIKSALGLFALIAVFGLFLFPRSASAYVGALVSDGYAEQYHVSVWASPNPIAVGNLKLLVRIAKPQNVSQELPLRGAKVTARFEHLSGTGTEAKPATGNQKISPVLFVSETEPGNYEVSNSIVADGNYRTTISIEADGKTTEYSFKFYAQPEANDLFISLGILALIVLFIFSLAIIYIRQYTNPVKEDSKETVNAEPATEIVGSGKS